MRFKVDGIWLGLAWGCAYAGRPAIQLVLQDVSREGGENQTSLSISFGSLVRILHRPIQQLNMIQIHSCPMDITGRIAEIGDPLSQVAVYPLVTHLLESLELRVCVHVSNRTDISLLDPRANIILIPFSPSTRHQDDNYWANLNYLSEDGEILFIVNSDEDYDWMIAVVDKFNLNTRFTVNMTTGKHRMPQNKWAKKLIKDAAPVHYLVPTPFTAIPLKIDKPEQSKY